MRRLGLITAVLAVLGSGAAVAASRTAYTVHSTLDGKTVLPRRIPWVVTSRPAMPKGSWLAFTVDGKTIDSDYVRRSTTSAGDSNTFAGDGGYLVTSWLAPGRHTFTVRLHPTGGSVVEKTTVAAVPGPAHVPAVLAGTWTRVVSDVTGAPAFGSPGNPTNTAVTTGIYELTFGPKWIEAQFPGAFNPATSFKTGRGLVFYNDWTPGARSFEAYGYVDWHHVPRSSPDAGSWCNAGGPVAGYSWSVSGDMLTLTPSGGADKCGIRAFIWAGTWTRAG